MSYNIKINQSHREQIQLAMDIAKKGGEPKSAEWSVIFMALANIETKCDWIDELRKENVKAGLPEDQGL